MKVRELLEYQSFVTKRATPSDMFEGDLEQHYSTSKEEYMDISSLKTQLRNIQEELNVLVDKSE